MSKVRFPSYLFSYLEPMKKKKSPNEFFFSLFPELPWLEKPWSQLSTGQLSSNEDKLKVNCHFDRINGQKNVLRSDFIETSIHSEWIQSKKNPMASIFFLSTPTAVKSELIWIRPIRRSPIKTKTKRSNVLWADKKTFFIHQNKKSKTWRN